MNKPLNASNTSTNNSATDANSSARDFGSVAPAGLVSTVLASTVERLFPFPTVAIVVKEGLGKCGEVLVAERGTRPQLGEPPRRLRLAEAPADVVAASEGSRARVVGMVPPAIAEQLRARAAAERAAEGRAAAERASKKEKGLRTGARTDAERAADNASIERIHDALRPRGFIRGETAVIILCVAGALAGGYLLGEVFSYLLAILAHAAGK